MTSTNPKPDELIAGRSGFAVPLVVAVTGHRDLVDAEVPGIRERVHSFLSTLAEEHPRRGVTLMTGLAAGADQLVAEEALALDLPVIAALPMAIAEYERDFAAGEARDHFHRLLDSCAEVFELPALDVPLVRERQYANLGVFLSAHCHILLALWDGKYSEETGGTSQVVRFHHDEFMPTLSEDKGPSRLVLADDESDLVFHVVCSRDRPDGAVTEGLEPLSTAWFTTDTSSPRSDELPARYRVVFQRTDEFCADAETHAADIEASSWSLATGQRPEPLPAGAGDIDRIYQAANWLAMRFQARHLRVLRLTHLLAFGMGLAYIAYSDWSPQRWFIVCFVGLFLLAAVTHKLGRRHAWHRKYLDYRTLAEGLRVQYYWTLGGVTAGQATHYAHDNFLQMQDSDLGWIRNVMRVAGMESNVRPSDNPAQLQQSIDEWIGDDDSGQLGYYRRKARERIRRNRRTERLAAIVLWCSIAAFSLFVFAGPDLADAVRDEVVIFMGALLLAAGIRQSYGYSVADFELIKQYEFMLRTFSRARTRIACADTDTDRRRLLKLVGDAALDEHAEWLLMHRERSVSEGELWRMTS